MSILYDRVYGNIQVVLDRTDTWQLPLYNSTVVDGKGWQLETQLHVSSLLLLGHCRVEHGPRSLICPI